MFVAKDANLYLDLLFKINSFHLHSTMMKCTVICLALAWPLKYRELLYTSLTIVINIMYINVQERYITRI